MNDKKTVIKFIEKEWDPKFIKRVKKETQQAKEYFQPITEFTERVNEDWTKNTKAIVWTYDKESGKLIQWEDDSEDNE